eukprot:COSAG06_NODE_415_length_15998_cov_3.107428_8_plen_215_part_00
MPIGNPEGEAVYTRGTGVWHRSFEHVEVTFDTSTNTSTIRNRTVGAKDAQPPVGHNPLRVNLTTPTAAASSEAKLTWLASLHERGFITDAVYTERQNAVLDQEEESCVIASLAQPVVVNDDLCDRNRNRCRVVFDFAAQMTLGPWIDSIQYSAELVSDPDDPYDILQGGIPYVFTDRGIDNTTVSILYDCILDCDRNAPSGSLIVNVQATQCPH